jgi:hypothetical protein
MSISSLSSFAQLGGSIIIALLCFINYKRISLPIKFVGYYALSSILFQLAQITVKYIITPKNRGLNEIGDGFVLAETILISLVFYFAFKNRNTKRIIVSAIACYLIFFVCAQLMLTENLYSTIRIGREAIMISLGIGYLYYLMKVTPEKDLMRFPSFWISASALFYFSGTFILSLFLSYLSKNSPELVTPLWTFRNFFRVAFCLVLSYAVLLDIKKGTYGTNTF